MPGPNLHQLSQDKTGGIVAFRTGTSVSASSTPKAHRRFCSRRMKPTPHGWPAPNASPYVKDGIDNYIVHGKKDAVNPEKKGTKVSAHYPLTLGAGESRTIRLRLSDQKIGGKRSAFREGL